MEMAKIEDGDTTVIPVATAATTTIVELGAAPQVFAAGQAAQGQMQVAIPQGLTVGMTFMVATPNGQQISVCVPEGYVPGQVLTVLVPPLAPGPTGGAAPLPSIEALVHEIKSGICCQRTMIGIMFAIQIFGILVNPNPEFGIHFTMFKVALFLVLAGVYAYCECPAKRTV